MKVSKLWRYAGRSLSLPPELVSLVFGAMYCLKYRKVHTYETKSHRWVWWRITTPEQEVWRGPAVLRSSWSCPTGLRPQVSGLHPFCWILCVVLRYSHCVLLMNADTQLCLLINNKSCILSFDITRWEMCIGVMGQRSYNFLKNI